MRNFECVLLPSQNRQLKERSSSLRNIKAPSAQAEEPGFDRVLASAGKFREFISETVSFECPSLFACFCTEDSEPFESLLLESFKSLL